MVQQITTSVNKK